MLYRAPAGATPAEENFTFDRADGELLWFRNPPIEHAAELYNMTQFSLMLNEPIDGMERGVIAPTDSRLRSGSAARVAKPMRRMGDGAGRWKGRRADLSMVAVVSRQDDADAEAGEAAARAPSCGASHACGTCLPARHATHRLSQSRIGAPRAGRDGRPCLPARRARRTHTRASRLQQISACLKRATLMKRSGKRGDWRIYSALADASTSRKSWWFVRSPRCARCRCLRSTQGGLRAEAGERLPSAGAVTAAACVRQWEPRWFRLTTDEDTGDECYHYRGGYWEARAKADWSGSPSIY